MNHLLHELLSVISPWLLLLSALLFLIGVALAPMAVERQIRMLLWYPNWIWSKLQQFMARKPGFWQLWLVIFLLNSISLLFNLCCGFGVLLPFVIAVVLGLNVGIIGYQEGGWKMIWALLAAPHALLELPAAWLSLALGMNIGLTIIEHPIALSAVTKASLAIYLKLILALLVLAAVIEAGLIARFSGRSQHPVSFANQPFAAQPEDDQDQ